MANRADRMLKTFETGFGAGKGIGERLYKGYKSDAIAAVHDTQGIPAPNVTYAQNQEVGGPTNPDVTGPDHQSPSDKMMAEQWAPDAEYIASQGAGYDPSTPVMQQQKYGNDLTAWRNRKQEALTEAAKYLDTTEMGAMEDRYNKKQKEDYLRGMTSAADMLDRFGDNPTDEQKNALANHLTNTYALKPSGSSAVASVVDGEVVMSFFNESTGEVQGSIPIGDSDFLRTQAAAYDDPQWGKEFEITERKMVDAEERTDILFDAHMLNVDKEKNQVAYRQYDTARKALADDATARNAVATAYAKQSKAIKDRAEAVDKRVSTHMKDGQDENGVPWNTFGDRMGFQATATGIGVMNPGMMGAQPLVATQQIREIQNQKAIEYMNSQGGQEKYEQWGPGDRIPQEALAESYKSMLASESNPEGVIFNEKDKDGKATGQIYYSMNGEKVYLPPIVTGNGQPMSHIGMIYKATNGGGIYSDAEKELMRSRVTQGVAGKSPGGQAPAPATTTVGVVGGGSGQGIPSSQSAQPAPAAQQPNPGPTGVPVPMPTPTATYDQAPTPTNPGAVQGNNQNTPLANRQNAVAMDKAVGDVVALAQDATGVGRDIPPAVANFIMKTPAAMEQLTPLQQRAVQRAAGQ